jgi:hypothetical protein
MNLRKSCTSPPEQLVDALMESYVAWREQTAAVNKTYTSFSRAAPEQRAAAFDDYLAALDREEDAAWRYGRMVAQVKAA